VEDVDNPFRHVIMKLKKIQDGPDAALVKIPPID
jgi:hypothetical protein